MHRRSPEPWTLGVGYEFEQRADGLAALDKTYHCSWQGSPKTMDLGLFYKALEQGQVTYDRGQRHRRAAFEIGFEGVWATISMRFRLTRCVSWLDRMRCARFRGCARR